MREKKYSWREKIGKRLGQNEIDWRVGLYKEFIEFVNETYELATIYDWNFWGGGTDNYAVTLSQAKRDGICLSIKMLSSDKYKYYVSFYDEFNPNNIDSNQYKEFIGENLDEALKYIHKFLMENKYDRSFNGSPTRVVGSGYNKCYLRIKWAKEEIAQKIIDEIPV